ncbi:MAG: hypothetical protein A3G35_02645 [candidate division NC10 bacterium RIFCSPLOWO2_12_FULL_66_18]|nr:MAG: hypothetical protein A3H39_08340 [candidate division NC10 bacterium RIFCSPLOWO2_02_FULL_66_22]OGC00078.1 MAG: hypothetical protein A3G35_02645 [candidate division NC10 bacterium RIFCSPLOWO2_12_FULL_66_18]
MLAFFFLVLIGSGVVTVLMAPFLWGRHGDALEVAPEAPSDLLARKEAAYSALKELEFDYRTRKLSQEDYEELRAVYRVEAAEALKAMDQGATPPRDLDALIDAEVSAWRARRVNQEGAVHETA